jgi:hypothetical protein
MAFEVGEVVTPVTNLNINGVEAPTVGVPGTVLARQNVGQDSEGNPYYTYQVQLSQELTFGEEEAQQSGQVFWFSESDLGSSAGVTTPAGVDEGAVTTSVGVAKSATDSTAGVISQMKGNISIDNPYYDALNLYQKVAESNSQVLSNTSIDSSDPNSLNRQGGAITTQSELYESDAKILQEISENVYGFYTITSEAEAALKQEQADAETQEKLATEDDSQTFETFVSTFIESPVVTGLLAPDSESTAKIVSSPDSEEDLSEINPADLITEDLGLEQD